ESKSLGLCLRLFDIPDCLSAEEDTKDQAHRGDAAAARRAQDCTIRPRASATSVLSVVEKRSVLLREQRRQPLRHATPQRSLSPLLEPDLLRSLQVLEEPLLEGVREARVLDGDDVFVVQLLGADVHVGRADDAPGTVSDE